MTEGRCRIERIASGLVIFFSEKVGMDYGAPQGGWTPDIEQATIFNNRSEAERVIASNIPALERATSHIIFLEKDNNGER